MQGRREGEFFVVFLPKPSKEEKLFETQNFYLYTEKANASSLKVLKNFARLLLNKLKFS